MTSSITGIALILAIGALWFHTGRDPLFWLIQLLIIIRAVIHQAYLETTHAARNWWQAMPSAIARSKQEVLGYDRA